MAYALSRNYRTDLSRTNAKAILENMAHEIVEARGDDFPTKNAFEIPEVRDEDDDDFIFELLPTVTEAGFEPEDLVPFECVYDDRYYIRLLGTVAAYEGEPAELHVILRKARRGDAINLKGNTSTFEDYLDFLRRKHDNR